MRHDLWSRVLLAAPALVLASAAGAAPNVEYGESYEAAYLAACAAHAAPSTCQCSMEAIEGAISFRAFAELVETHGGDISRALPAATVEPALQAHCGIPGLWGPARAGVSLPDNQE